MFKAKSKVGARLAKTVKILQDKYKLLKKDICCVKDEGANLKSLWTALELVVTCDLLGLNKLDVGFFLVMLCLRLVSMALIMR